jgi:hypothetical protein
MMAGELPMKYRKVGISILIAMFPPFASISSGRCGALSKALARDTRRTGLKWLKQEISRPTVR